MRNSWMGSFILYSFSKKKNTQNPNPTHCVFESPCTDTLLQEWARPLSSHHAIIHIMVSANSIQKSMNGLFF